jgi:hypothetical protein
VYSLQIGKGFLLSGRVPNEFSNTRVLRILAFASNSASMTTLPPDPASLKLKMGASRMRGSARSVVQVGCYESGRLNEAHHA